MSGWAWENPQHGGPAEGYGRASRAFFAPTTRCQARELAVPGTACWGSIFQRLILQRQIAQWSHPPVRQTQEETG